METHEEMTQLESWEWEAAVEQWHHDQDDD